MILLLRILAAVEAARIAERRGYGYLGACAFFHDLIVAEDHLRLERRRVAWAA